MLSADLPFAVDSIGPGVDPNRSFVVHTLSSDAAVATDSAHRTPLTLVVVDPSTPDYQSTIDELAARTGERLAVHVLDADSDGVTQLTDLLNEQTNVSTLHLLSQGEDGKLSLGDASVGLTDLLARAEEVGGWRSSFANDGSVLIHGTDLAAAQGQNLVTTLGELTRTTVSASAEVSLSQWFEPVSLNIVLVDTTLDDYDQLIAAAADSDTISV